MEKPQANKQRKKKKTSDPNTLFVKFTPPSPYITRHHLSNYFSNWGPVNKCSVIRNKSKPLASNNDNGDKDGSTAQEGEDKREVENQGDRGTKGYGFIRFVNVDDAISAATAIKEQNSNSQLKKGMTVDGILYKIVAERAVDAVNNTQNVQKKENSSNDTEEKEEINKVTPPQSNNSTPTTLTKEEELSKYKTESKRKRTSRVIIRNLSFYANQSNIIQVMENLFGPVSVVDLPLVPNNTTSNTTSSGQGDKDSSNIRRGVTRHRGFAFVTFTNSNAARMAVEYDKEIRIKNRVVAIDFSISKVEHQRLLREEKDGKKKEEESSDSDSESSEEGSDGESNSDSSSDSDDSIGSEEESEGDSESDSEDEEKDSDDDKKDVEQDTEEVDKPPPEDQFTTSNESKRTLFLRNIPFDATRHDVFELFRKFGRIEGVYLVKDKITGVFKGTAFVRFENEEGCMNALDEATGGGQMNSTSQFVSSKNMTMSGESESSSLTLKGRTILLDLAVDRTTASSLAIQRDEDGKPIKKMVGKDKRNLYLKNEGRVSSSTDSGHAQEASAKHGGLWEDLPMSDRAKRERAFADKSTKLRSSLFFINPNRISIRNLNKEVNESQLKSLGKFYM